MRRGSILIRWALCYLLCALALLAVLIGLSADFYNGGDPVALRHRIEWFGLAVIVIVAALAWLLWIPLARRLGRIRDTVRSYANGDFTPRLAADDRTELGELSSELNWMAHQLHLRSLVEQERQQTQEAVLSSMIEGVMAIDTEGHVISMNRAGRAMLNAENVEVEGYLVTELIRQEELLQFIRRASSKDEPVDADIALRGSPERHVQLTSNALTDPVGQRLGTLIVMNDVTRVRRLESMRRDFVANVSHELRTPITSIKGFMETLMDGAMEKPEDARRFLAIIAKQADRLDAIIEDLLSLSRVEQESERGEIALKDGRITDVLNAAVQAVQAKADARGVRLEVACPEKLTARINAPLLEQAVVNLVDNAVKYSDDGQSVRVNAGPEAGAIYIKVADEGHGIAKEHHGRIFQRFYRVDKSRSRQLGGTGLGLSIVKHITQAHGGTVSVESVVGKGSTFTLRLLAQ